MIVFGGRDTIKGWDDLKATKLNALVDAWDFLTRSPMEMSGACHQLRGDLATVSRDGVAHDQWQLELPGGARIWFYVTARVASRHQRIRPHTPRHNGKVERYNRILAEGLLYGQDLDLRGRPGRRDQDLEHPLQLPSPPHRRRRPAPGLTPPRRRHQCHEPEHLDVGVDPSAFGTQVT